MSEPLKAQALKNLMVRYQRQAQQFGAASWAPVPDRVGFIELYDARGDSLGIWFMERAKKEDSGYAYNYSLVPVPAPEKEAGIEC